LVAIGAALGMSEVAVRSAVARLAREHWIVARRNGQRSYYRLSQSGRALIKEGTQRIYHADGRAWSGQWCLLSYSVPESKRALRDRMRKQLAWLGFGPLGSGTYLAARDASADVRRLAERLGAGNFAKTFLARSAGSTSDDQIVRQCWDLARIGQAYERFIRHYAPLYRRDQQRKRRRRLADADAFIVRFALTHDFRRFPFIDPDLPRRLLPKNWAGARARKLFEGYHAMLTDGALRFFAASSASSSSG
ncbi:MAG TPA: PaaX family transcriptional regulator C-terminal domain-containing protein, partial [Candidatus Eremiobacteraceae bacterium]|nr:PaaX family transcriptional regulator C-terminal domain-containing protein [Candidatus Eremiobacteraceae bacterium]